MIWITSLCLLAVFAWLLFNGLNERRWVQAHAHDETVAKDEGLFASLTSATGSGGLPGVTASAGAAMKTVREKTSEAVETVREKSGPALERAKEKSGPAFEKMKEKSAPAIEKMKEKSGPAIDKVKEKSGPAFDKMKEKSGPAFDKVKEKSGPAFEKVKEKSGPALSAMQDKSSEAYQNVKAKSGEYKDRLAERRNSGESGSSGDGEGVLAKLGAVAGTAARKVDGGIDATMRAAGNKAESMKANASDPTGEQSSFSKALGKVSETTSRVGSNMGEKARQRNEVGEDGFFTKLVSKLGGK